MKISASTLGCPAWDLPTVLARAKSYGYDGVDFRGLGAELDVTKLPAFTRDLEKTKRMVQNTGLVVSCISSSVFICDATRRQEYIEEARRTIPVALGLGAKNVRVLGGGVVDNGQRAQAIKIGRDCMAEILALPDATKLSWNLETHDVWTSAADCKLLLDAVNNPAFALLWDMAGSFHEANETPEQVYSLLGPRIRYTHINDMIFDKSHPQAEKSGWRCVQPGTGQLPLAEGIKLLQAKGFDGWYVFEHEKRWVPTLPEPEVAFPPFVKWIRAL